MKQKGFTLIELLVVISIIGLLSTLAIVSLNNARSKSRDAKRVSDIKQIQSALELYFNDANEYPASLPSGQALTFNGVTYMGSIPSNPTPARTAGETYVYTAAGSNTSYSITFGLEGATGQLPAGVRTATPAGIQ